MKATIIVAFLPNSAADQVGAAFPEGIAAELFDAGERDALSSLNPTQPHEYWYAMGYHDGLYQREIGDSR